MSIAAAALTSLARVGRGCRHLVALRGEGGVVISQPWRPDGRPPELGVLAVATLLQPDGDMVTCWSRSFLAAAGQAEREAVAAAQAEALDQAAADIAALAGMVRLGCGTIVVLGMTAFAGSALIGLVQGTWSGAGLLGCRLLAPRALRWLLRRAAARAALGLVSGRRSGWAGDH